ncbi:MAG: flagellar filament capping protein FliD [Geminicoccaceae bacterium]|jgi:flagellar hook-associated protein 2|nr:flagellar filament capping protein FliD [Geminicoccaceae bacterium]MCB9969064.1 flagellar filament capping protein FliD [Geminicoccaceae bacterium]
MASSISFGSLSTSSGSPRLSGTSSKLDTEAVLQATYEAKRLPAVRLGNKTTTNETKIAAYESMQGLLEGLRSAANGLRNPPGFLGARDNAFETKQAFLGSSTTTAPGEIVGVALANTAQAGSFDLRVTQLATAEKLATPGAAAANATLADAWNAGDPFSGTIELGVAGGPTAVIDLDGDLGLYDLRDRINAVRSTTGVGASVLKVADNDFRLVLAAEETGKAITLNDTSGLTGGFSTTTLQTAQPAIFEIDGVSVTRTSNQVDDLMGGVTINLFKAEPGTTVAVSVEPSLGDIKSRIVAFVEAFNALRGFVNEQSAVDASGGPAADAVLFGDRTMRGIMTGLGGIVGGSVAGLDADALGSFRAIGIELDATNQLEIDDAKLDNALLTKLDDVRDIFEFRYRSSSSELAIFARSNALAATTMQLEITDADNDGTPEAVTINGQAAEIAGSTIKGAAGTAFEGLEFIWTGRGSTVIDVEASQGLADRVFNFVKPAVDPLDGSIPRAIDSLRDLNGNYAKQMERIEERATRARDLLVERFSAMEAALSLANAMLAQIRAQIDAMTQDS